MKNGGDDPKLLVLDHFVNHTIRESPGISPTDVLCGMADTVQERVHFECVKNRFFQ
jgi:hypothetical protein